MSVRSLRIAGAGFVSIALAASLSGCLVTDNHASVGDFADEAVRRALDDASGALDDVASALDGIKSDLTDSLGDLSGTLGTLGDIPELLDDLFASDGAATKTDRVVVEDAQTGEVVADITDADGLKRVVSTFSDLDCASWELVSSVPDTAEDRVLRFFQHDTVLLGQSVENTESSEVARLTTFDESNVIEITVLPLDFTLQFTISGADLAALNGLA